jgi:hypothetical protein
MISGLRVSKETIATGNSTEAPFSAKRTSAFLIALIRTKIKLTIRIKSGRCLLTVIISTPGIFSGICP